MLPLQRWLGRQILISQRFLKKACSISSRFAGANPATLDQRELIRGASLSLSEREKQILSLVLKKLSNREIGERLALSQRTIEAHRASAYRKLHVNGLQQLQDISKYFDWI